MKLTWLQFILMVIGAFCLYTCSQRADKKTVLVVPSSPSQTKKSSSTTDKKKTEDKNPKAKAKAKADAEKTAATPLSPETPVFEGWYPGKLIDTFEVVNGVNQPCKVVHYEQKFGVGIDPEKAAMLPCDTKAVKWHMADDMILDGSELLNRGQANQMKISLKLKYLSKNSGECYIYDQTKKEWIKISRETFFTNVNHLVEMRYIPTEDCRNPIGWIEEPVDIVNNSYVLRLLAYLQ